MAEDTFPGRRRPRWHRDSSTSCRLGSQARARKQAEEYYSKKAEEAAPLIPEGQGIRQGVTGDRPGEHFVLLLANCFLNAK